MRLAALVATLALLALPLAALGAANSAAVTPPAPVAPAGTMIAAFAVSDGTTLRPLGITVIAGAVCAPVPS